VDGGAIALAIIGLLTGIGRGLLFAAGLGRCAERPEKSEAAASAPRVGIAVGRRAAGCGLQTLVLGIAPGEVLRAAEAGAHTLQAPSTETSASGVSVAQEPKPLALTDLPPGATGTSKLR